MVPPPCHITVKLDLNHTQTLTHRHKEVGFEQCAPYTANLIKIVLCRGGKNIFLSGTIDPKSKKFYQPMFLIFGNAMELEIKI